MNWVNLLQQISIWDIKEARPYAPLIILSREGVHRAAF
jgi:hypothetical protein